MSEELKKVAILTGPTASGKTQLALSLARSIGCEIINADSLLVYRGMDIGTAKPSPQEREEIPHHLIDICGPDEPFTAGDFVRRVFEVIEDIHRRSRRAMIVGGTGFYLKALVFGLWDAPKADAGVRATLQSLSSAELYQKLASQDEPSALRITQGDRYRLIRALEVIAATGKTPSELEAEHETAPNPIFETWIVDRDPEEINRRIHVRTDAMLAPEHHGGLIAEVKRLRESYPESRALLSIGYAQVIQHLDGIRPAGRKVQPGIQGLQDEIELATRQLVKQQRTWFRSFGTRARAHRICLESGKEEEQTRGLERDIRELYRRSD